MDKVMSAIDGRRTVRAHGDRKMPVWGEIFRKEAEGGKYPELRTLLKAKLIARVHRNNTEIVDWYTCKGSFRAQTHFLSASCQSYSFPISEKSSELFRINET
jgi:hypothetical protein